MRFAKGLATLAAAAGLLLGGAGNIRHGAEARCAPGEGLGFICGPVASEDIARVPDTPWLIASGLNIGRRAHLYLIDTRAKTAAPLFPRGHPEMKHDRRLAPDCPGPPDLSRMSTDGLGLRRGARGLHTLYAANHGDRMAIEMFEVDTRGAKPKLRWVGCAPMPAETLPNAVAPLPGGRLIVTSFYDPTDKTAWARMARGEATGRLLEWRPDGGFRDLPGGTMSGANGVETSADGETIYASAWSGRALVVMSRQSGARREIPLPFMPDNIRRQADGSLLVTGQHGKVEDIAACTAQCPQAWEVARVDPRSGAVAPLLKRPGTAAVNYGCTALAVDGVLYITARGDARIAYARVSDLPSLQ